MQSRDRQTKPVSLLQHLRWLDLQSREKGFKGFHAGGILLTLDHADVAIEPGRVGELLLREPAFAPQSFEICVTILRSIAKTARYLRKTLRIADRRGTPALSWSGPRRVA